MMLLAFVILVLIVVVLSKRTTPKCGCGFWMACDEHSKMMDAANEEINKK